MRGWVLLPRYELSQLNLYATNLVLTIGDPTQPNNVQPLGNLSIKHAHCATRGLASDPNALYLIELTDDRGILSNEWFQFPLTAAYNIRAPAYPQTFFPWSLNSGTTWTWATMLQDIWTRMSSELVDTWPGLPSTPTGTPEGFWFQGVAAWPAFTDVLDYLGMTVACDLTNATTPYTIVNIGQADAAFAALQAKYATNIEDDLEWQDTGAARVPGTVYALFRRRNSIYGTEEVARYDSPFQWESGILYSVTVQAPATFTGAVGSHRIFCDFTVRYDQDGNPLADDVVQANAIAQERVGQYYNRIYRGTSGMMTQTYAGALPFVIGSQVDGVAYYQDYRFDDYGGWRTQIIRGYPPWTELCSGREG
jgi:hypothetical protein